MDYAVTDRRLTRLDFLVLWIFTSAADWRTGSGRRQQTEVAKLLGCTRRAVRRCLDRLVACNYLDPVGPKPGKYISAYNILGAKRRPCGPLLSANGKGDPAVLKRDPGVQKEDPPFPHSTFNPVISPCDDRESGAGGPRGPEGLGPPPEKPARPYADIEATIRTVLADRARLFAGARVTEADEQSILIGYLTDHHASELRPFADDIQAATGAEQVRFTVALGPGLKRRLQ